MITFTILSTKIQHFPRAGRVPPPPTPTPTWRCAYNDFTPSYAPEKSMLSNTGNCILFKLKSILFYIDFIVDTSNFATILINTLICSWNQPVLSNEGQWFCSRKKRETLMGFKLTYYKWGTVSTIYPLLYAPTFAIQLPSKTTIQ